MNKTYHVELDPRVLREDFRRITQSDQEKIVKSLQNKLSTHPEKFGKHLTEKLRGFYSLRVGEYRVIYDIQKEKITVLVIKIGFRRNMEVYFEAAKRLGIL